VRALSDEKSGQFSVFAGHCQRSISQFWVPRDSWAYFIVSIFETPPQPGRPDSCIYFPQEQGSPIIPPATALPLVSGWSSRPGRVKKLHFSVSSWPVMWANKSYSSCTFPSSYIFSRSDIVVGFLMHIPEACVAPPAVGRKSADRTEGSTKGSDDRERIK
jgi:hypothetical protein